MSNNQADLNDLRSTLEAATLAELRVRASKTFGIKVSRQHTQDQIIDEIMQLASKFEFAQDSEGDLKPGWSRIRVHPIPGRSKFPFPFNLNGYQGLIPLNREVDVPNKLIPMLRDAEENQYWESDDGNESGWRLQESYPFTLIEQKPGPDPKPGIEVQRAIRQKDKILFRDIEGHWPKDDELSDWKKLRAEELKAENRAAEAKELAEEASKASKSKG